MYWVKCDNQPKAVEVPLKAYVGKYYNLYIVCFLCIAS